MNKSNQIKLAGMIKGNITLDHVYNREYFYRFTLVTTRQSGIQDDIIVVFPDSIFNASNLSNYNCCHVIGSIKSHSVYDDKGNKTMLVYVSPTKIIPTLDLWSSHNSARIEGEIFSNSGFRLTPQGKEITNFVVKCGNKEKSDYIPCVAWNNNALKIDKMNMGDKIILNGRFQSRNYKKVINEIAETRTTYELSIESIEQYEWTL